jgi:hypothetical protein
VLGPEVEAEPRDVSECGDGRELVRGRPFRRPSGPEVVADSIVLESVGICSMWRPPYAVQHLCRPQTIGNNLLSLKFARWSSNSKDGRAKQFHLAPPAFGVAQQRARPQVRPHRRDRPPASPRAS